MLISTIIPVYNASEFLERCLNSILKAQLVEVKNEIVLINDGSTDNSLEICYKYKDANANIEVLDQQNQGPSAARNLGLKNSSGDYITFVDSDDYVEDNYFNVLINSIQKYNNVDIIIYGYFKKSKNSKNINYPYFEFDKCFEHKDILHLLKNTVNNTYLLFPHNKVYKRTLFDNGIRFDNKLRLGEDAIFNLETFYYSNSIIFVKKAIYNYFDNIDSITNQKYKPYLYDSMEYHFKRKLAFYKSKNDLNQKVYLNDIAKVNLEKTFYSFLSNILANKDLNFTQELKKIKKLELIKFSYKHMKLTQIRSLKSKIVFLLFKYDQYKLLDLMYKTQKNI